MNTRILFPAFTAIVLILATNASYAQLTPQQLAVNYTLDEFHQAIIDNDSSKAANLLSDSALILEGGTIETKEEYLAHHFYSDGKFLSAMNRETFTGRVVIKEDMAWVSTRTHTWGTYGERSLDLNSLELAVLIKEGENWKISALHWSSARRN